MVSKWDNELIQEKLIWLSRIVINSFASKIKIETNSIRFKIDSLENKTLIELAEIFNLKVLDIRDDTNQRKYFVYRKAK